LMVAKPSPKGVAQGTKRNQPSALTNGWRICGSDIRSYTADKP
jgi:hypothetical protein